MTSLGASLSDLMAALNVTALQQTSERGSKRSKLTIKVTNKVFASRSGEIFSYNNSNKLHVRAAAEIECQVNG